MLLDQVLTPTYLTGRLWVGELTWPVDRSGFRRFDVEKVPDPLVGQAWPNHEYFLVGTGCLEAPITNSRYAI